ncbi:hypothetical protein BBD42_31060 [Paenibacillus sp. BIHB 4019]|uniref:Uncharacterized protein n=1 Tax=Paenibacillus sp. BIHB 4019 TaxID=1870819 RepID=A0A1B2DRU8_9BACL|nr:hypothetical protein [Paenibacillus sp. BIHB 4019]ANY70444.1 hypothetical protein BBD42_31060 [Paenibacillus sp. BIHB 4019]
MNVEKKTNNKKQKRLIRIILAAAIPCLFILSALTSSYSDYSKAHSLLESKNYKEAIVQFENLGDYKDSVQMAAEANYLLGTQQLNSKLYKDAALTFKKIKDYRDSARMSKESTYIYALGLKSSKNYSESLNEFLSIRDYKDSEAQIKEVTNLKEYYEDSYQRPEIKSPSVGMTKQEVLDSTWGKPIDINKTTTKYGVSEQWVYKNYKYIYFEDGIVTTIQN